MDKSAFFTRSAHNEGKKLFLYTPDGKKTDEYLVVRGALSDEFRAKNLESMRKAMSAELNDEQRKELTYDAVAALIADWSFDEECTPEAVKELLKEAPQIEDQVNKFAGNRGNFLEKK